MIVPSLYAAIPPEPAISPVEVVEIEELIIPRSFTVAFDPKYPKRPTTTSLESEVILNNKLEIACP